MRRWCESQAASAWPSGRAAPCVLPRLPRPATPPAALPLRPLHHLPALYQEHCTKSSLDLPRRFGKFSEDLVRNYTRQLLLGLEYLHAGRVCHRDLKGGNVLVTRDGVVKLAGEVGGDQGWCGEAGW